MNQADTPASLIDASKGEYVVGIDSGSQTCRCCVLKPDKSQVLKPLDFPNAMAGFSFLQEQLETLGVEPDQILIGLEATSRDARKSLALSGKSQLATLLVTSTANPSVCAPTRTAG